MFDKCYIYAVSCVLCVVHTECRYLFKHIFVFIRFLFISLLVASRSACRDQPSTPLASFSDTVYILFNRVFKCESYTLQTQHNKMYKLSHFIHFIKWTTFQNSSAICRAFHSSEITTHFFPLVILSIVIVTVSIVLVVFVIWWWL